LLHLANRVRVRGNALAVFSTFATLLGVQEEVDAQEGIAARGLGPGCVSRCCGRRAGGFAKTGPARPRAPARLTRLQSHAAGSRRPPNQQDMATGPARLCPGTRAPCTVRVLNRNAQVRFCFCRISRRTPFSLGHSQHPVERGSKLAISHRGTEATEPERKGRVGSSTESSRVRIHRASLDPSWSKAATRRGILGACYSGKIDPRRVARDSWYCGGGIMNAPQLDISRLAFASLLRWTLAAPCAIAPLLVLGCGARTPLHLHSGSSARGERRRR